MLGGAYAVTGQSDSGLCGRIGLSVGRSRRRLRDCVPDGVECCCDVEPDTHSHAWAVHGPRTQSKGRERRLGAHDEHGVRISSFFESTSGRSCTCSVSVV